MTLKLHVVSCAFLLCCCCSDLGCHIDGFIATQAQTVLVASSFDTPITGKAADLVEAARTAFNAAIRLIKPGAHLLNCCT
jgi:methionine aminopeptidase